MSWLSDRADAIRGLQGKEVKNTPNVTNSPDWLARRAEAYRSIQANKPKVTVSKKTIQKPQPVKKTEPKGIIDKVKDTVKYGAERFKASTPTLKGGTKVGGAVLAEDIKDIATAGVPRKGEKVTIADAMRVNPLFLPSTELNKLIVESDPWKRAKASIEKKTGVDLDVTERLKKSGSKDYKKAQEATQKVVQKYGTPKKWSGKWLVGEVGGNAIPTVGSIGLGLATTAVTKNPQLGLYVGMSNTFMQESGSFYVQAKEEGASEADAQDGAVVVGTINSILETIPLGRALDKFDTSGKIKQKILSNISKYIMAKVKNATFEGTTETAQELISNAMRKTYKEDAGLFENLPESFVIGISLGLVGDISTDPITSAIQVMDPKAVQETQEIIDDALNTPAKERTPEQQAVVDNVNEKIDSMNLDIVTEEVKRETIKKDQMQGLPESIDQASISIRPDGTASFNIEVSETSRGQGDGAKAVKVMEATIADRGITKIELPVKEESVGFFEKQGYKADGEAVNGMVAMSKTLTKETKTNQMDEILQKEGWKNDQQKKEFATALLTKDAKTVEAMLPEIPQYYQEKFAEEIAETFKPAKTVAEAETGIHDFLADTLGGKAGVNESGFQNTVTVDGNKVTYQIAKNTDTQVHMRMIETDNKGAGMGSKFMEALKQYSDITGKPIVISSARNRKFFDKFTWLKSDAVGSQSYRYKPTLNKDASLPDLEKQMRDIYLSKQEAVDQAFSEIFAEMEIAEAGQRVFFEQADSSESGVMGIKSSFPSWVPDELRSRDLFDKVMGNLAGDIEKLTFPDGNRPKQRELYNAILDEVDSRAGVDTSEARSAILDLYEKPIQKQEAKQASKPVSRSPKGREEATAEEKLEEKLDKYLNNRTTKFRSRDLDDLTKNRELVVLHNIRGETIEKALEMGGLPVPSLAITKPSIAFSGFGEVTLVGGSNLAENVYTADVYSRRVPREKYEVNYKEKQKLLADLEPFFKDFGEYGYGNVYSAESPHDMLRASTQSVALKAMFLKEKGINVKPVKVRKGVGSSTPEAQKYLLDNKEKILETQFGWEDIRDNTESYQTVVDFIEKTYLLGKNKNSAEYRIATTVVNDILTNDEGNPSFGNLDRYWNYIRNFVKEPDSVDTGATEKAIEQAFSDNNLTPLEYSLWVQEKYKNLYGSQYFFNSRGTKKAYNLENIMEYMTGRVRGEESFFYGAGSVRSKIAKKLTTIQEMRQNKDMIQPDVDIEGVKDGFQNELAELLGEIADTLPQGARFSGIDGMEYIGSEVSKVGATFTRTKVSNALSKLGIDTEANSSLVDKTYDFLKRLQNAPTEYFEAKPQRVVDIGEFKGAVVNQYESPSVVQALRDKGLVVRVYDETIPEDRRLKVEELASELDIKFRVKDDVEKITGNKITDAQEAELIALNKRIFGDDNVKITLQIMANKKALGAYQGGIIQVLDGQVSPKETLYHEAVHKYIDVFTTRQEQTELFKAGIEKYGTDDLLTVEEKIAEDFISYAKSREGVTGKIKSIFDSILARINAYLGNADAIDKLYQDILSPAEKKVAKATEQGLPVGQGKQKESAFLERVKEQLLSTDPASYEFDEQTGKYNEMNLEDNANKAIDFITNNPEEAIAVSLGMLNPPQGVTANAIGLGTMLKARDEGNFNLYRDIATSVTLRSTRLGQEIVSLRGQMNDDSPENFVRRVIDARMKNISRSLLTDAEIKGRSLSDTKKKVTEKIEQETVKLKKKLSKDQIKVRLAQDIIDAMRC